MKRCPYCDEKIQDGAVKCRYCKESLNKNQTEWNNKVEPYATLISSVIINNCFGSNWVFQLKTSKYGIIIKNNEDIFDGLFYDRIRWNQFLIELINLYLLLTFDKIILSGGSHNKDFIPVAMQIWMNFIASGGILEDNPFSYEDLPYNQFGEFFKMLNYQKYVRAKLNYKKGNNLLPMGGLFNEKLNFNKATLTSLNPFLLEDFNYIGTNHENIDWLRSSFH